MHELSIAKSIVDSCVARAEGGRIVKIRIEVGQLAAVLPDSLRFCFEICAQGTAAEGAVLDILETPGRAICEACGESILLTSPFGRCACGGRLKIVAGQELKMKDMEIA